jgi:uncharacterized protein YndB with AHSA1/START domain
LAIPPAVAGAGLALGLPPVGKLYLWLALACGAAALAINAFGRAQLDRRSLDEQAADLSVSSTAIALALAIDSVVLLLYAGSNKSVLLISGLAVLWALIWMPRLTRRVRVRTSIVIDRDPSTVFGFVSDFRNAPKWFPQFETVEKLTPGSIGPGTQFRFRQQTPNGMLELVDEIVEYEWASRLTDRVAGAHRANVEVLTFEPVDRATRLEHQFISEVSYAAAIIGQVLYRWNTTGQMRRQRQAAWARLKQVLEGQPPA